MTNVCVNLSILFKGGSLISDAWFIMPNILTTKLLLKKSNSPIYHYQYAHHGSFTFCDVINFNWKNWVGKWFMRFFGSDAFVNELACHGDEIFLLFKGIKLTLPLFFIYELWVIFAYFKVELT